MIVLSCLSHIIHHIYYFQYNHALNLQLYNIIINMYKNNNFYIFKKEYIITIFR